MTFPIEAGIQISLNDDDWYKITDHNRSPISIKTELIEKVDRMANGTMRKYVVAKKDTISVSWTMIPANAEETVDGHHSSAWVESFYAANAGLPIYLRVVSAQLGPVPAIGQAPDEEDFETSEETHKDYNVFITDFSKTLKYRTKTTDYVDMTLEFTEI